MPFAPTRKYRHAATLWAASRGCCRATGTRRTHCYAAKPTGVLRSQCWSHPSRGFEQAVDAEPELAEAAPAPIGAFYANGRTIRAWQLKGVAELVWWRKRSTLAASGRARAPADAAESADGVEVRAVLEGRWTGLDEGERRRSLASKAEVLCV